MRTQADVAFEVFVATSNRDRMTDEERLLYDFHKHKNESKESK